MIEKHSPGDCSTLAGVLEDPPLTVVIHLATEEEKICLHQRAGEAGGAGVGEGGDGGGEAGDPL